MTAKFTSGPWRLAGNDLIGGEPSDEMLATMIATIEPQTAPSRYRYRAPRTEAIGNARIISQALAMYQILEKLVAADNCNYSAHAMRQEGYFDVARSIMAKIRTE